MTDTDQFETELSPFADDAGVAEIDALYRQALSAMDAVEEGVKFVEESVEFVDEEFAETTETDEGTNADIPITEPTAVPRQDDEPNDDDAIRNDANNGELELSGNNANDDNANGNNASGDETGVSQNRGEPTPLTVERILEAALFVGGTSLTTKKLRMLLRGDFSAGFIENAIAELNQRYEIQRRPYEIVFGEGGYRMELKSEYSSVRSRVFGLGPREIRLTQEALELLSLVAYRQPVTPAEAEKIRGKSAAGLLRQLLRRELISLDRNPDNRKQVEYRTTPRFLQLFGLSHLDELPQADDLQFK